MDLPLNSEFSTNQTRIKVNSNDQTIPNHTVASFSEIRQVIYEQKRCRFVDDINAMNCPLCWYRLPNDLSCKVDEQPNELPAAGSDANLVVRSIFFPGLQGDAPLWSQITCDSHDVIHLADDIYTAKSLQSLSDSPRLKPEAIRLPKCFKLNVPKDDQRRLKIIDMSQLGSAI